MGPAQQTGWTDISAGGWVARLPASWRPYAVLARLDRPIGSWLLFLPGLWSILLAGAAPAASVRLILLFGLGAVVMRSAGCVVNDMWDREVDRQVTRTAGRPLASGALRMRQAAVFLLRAAAGSGWLVLLQLNRRWPRCWASLSLVLVALYPLGKAGDVVAAGGRSAITFSWAAPMGYAAATGHA